MPSDDLNFTEIEHKFVVGDEFDFERFAGALNALGPVRVNAIRVSDRYYLVEGGIERRFLIRHRYDADLHHLTIKSLETDTEVRDEINLDLGQHAGDQAQRVDAFMKRLGVLWSGSVQKDINVWYFADCEVVHYVASTTDVARGFSPALTRTVRCVEFEATRKKSVPEALSIVEAFERATGFDALSRSNLSLPQLLFPELSEKLRPA